MTQNTRKNHWRAELNLRPLIILISLILSVMLLNACSGHNQSKLLMAQQTVTSVDQLLPVDCLLPSQVRQLGKSISYMPPRQAVKTTAMECEIRGGEYVKFDRANMRTSLKIWMASAQAGNAEAQTYVGEIFEKGMGTAIDYASAYAWYQKAANQGNARAQLNLGYLYEKGFGVQADPKQALNWYRKASGITDEIDYSSTLTAKATTMAQEQTEKLHQEIRRREQEINALNKQLKTTQHQLKSRATNLNKARQQLNYLKQQIQKQHPSGSTVTPQVTALQQQLQQQQQQVAQQEKTLTSLRQELQQQQASIGYQNRTVDQQRSRYQQQVAEAPLPAPTIEVFEPSIAMTRNGETVVRVRSGTNTQMIDGKISAPGGLNSASINGQRLNPDRSGFFHGAVSLAAGNTRVEIIAEDKSGKKTSTVFILQPPTSTSPTPAPIEVGRIARTVDFGNYYALIIGNNEYKHYPDLQTPVNDAVEAERIFREHYGFKTQLLKNADRRTILSALTEFKDKLTATDNFLVYYAGHGERDAETLNGYWLPTNAEPQNRAEWISNNTVSEFLNMYQSKHILIMADSCYSGSMTSTSVARADTPLSSNKLQKWLKLMTKIQSRTVLTSGGVKPVLDSGGGQHSVFASVLFKELKKNHRVLDAYRIYRSISRKVQTTAATVGFEQTPTYAPIQHTGHEGGEFVFVGS